MATHAVVIVFIAIQGIKKPLNCFSGPGFIISRRLFLRIQPGYAIITEGFHDLSVDCMNTSFFLVNHKINKWHLQKKAKYFHIAFFAPCLLYPFFLPVLLLF